MQLLTKKQKSIYNNLCDLYNSLGFYPSFSLQSFIYAKYENALRKKQSKANDILAVYNFSNNDF